jgi:hypothetical protein
MIHLILRLGVSLLPLGLTPLLVLFIGEGYLNFGGGCKDVFLLIPWVVWSLLFLIISLVGWWKKWPLAKGVVFSALGATALLSAAFLALLISSLSLAK